MLPLVNCNEMRTADRAAIAAGIPGRILMENAATFALSEVRKFPPSFVPVFCGKGNNAGDGFALARRLFVGNIQTEIVLTESPEAFSGDAAENFLAAKNLGVKITAFSDFSKRRTLPSGTVAVDALLGTGVRGEVGGVIGDAIDYLNASGVPVVSLDLPSGISGDTGKVCGRAVKAAKTVTFGYRKLGLYSPLSADYVGEVVCDDISIPAPNVSRFLIEAEDVKFLPLSKAAHKGVRGHAVFLGGSMGMAGAAVLASMAAERIGAGLVTAMVPKEILPILSKRLTGTMCMDIEGKIPEKANVLIVGCGLGREADGEKALLKALDQGVDTLIIDADGLYHLTKHLHLLKDAAKEVILTPHMGEMSRLCGLSVSEITENRVEVAEKFAKEYGVTLVLKGAHTVVAKKDGRTYINTTGNPGMAKGGSGDVLAGIIGGLCAQGIEESAKCGVFLHGKCGDMAAEAEGERCMTAETLVKFISEASKCM